MTKQNTRKRKQAKQQQKRQRQMRLIGVGLVAAIAIIAILVLTSTNNRLSVSFPDIHGMSFAGDGSYLRVATHTGLVTYQDGGWARPDVPINDYMGYSGTEAGFFSSGHPGAGSNLVNPIGLVRSGDAGATVDTINFLGETDFHVMGASYYSNTIYVLNPSPNSLLSAGLHYSLDGGLSWEQSDASGLLAAPLQITVHPTENSTIAAATQGGAFISHDFGDTFTRIGEGSTITAAAFDPRGHRLLFGFDTLFSYSLDDGQITALPESPSVDTDQVILYIAINPVTEEIAVTTSDRDIFFSPDDGETWTLIGENGASR